MLAAASFGFAQPSLWTAALGSLQLLSMACLPLVIFELRTKRTPVVWALLVAGSLAIIAGAHDLLTVRMAIAVGSPFPWTPHAMFVFVLILGGLMVERYSRTVQDYRALNASLNAQVSTREAQLRRAFETIRVQQQEQAVLSERQRMMRELHDGVGSQLVGLLNVVAQPSSDRAMMEEHVNAALDEMRMAVDSLQPAHDDLGTVLATLRYRLQARLDAAGIELIWDVDNLPAMVPVTAQQGLHFQRIFLEAFTNVLKHANATRIVLRAAADQAVPGMITIKIADNGTGWHRPRGSDRGVDERGQGLSNMQSRALSLNATLEILTATVDGNGDQGTCVVLAWLPRALGSRVGG